MAVRWRFNPCCNGNDVELSTCFRSVRRSCVLILVVMEMM